MNYKRTHLEEKMKSILDSLHIEYAEQVSTRSGFVIDFAMYVDRQKDKKIALETDGSYWHSSINQRKRDQFRDHILRQEGWKIIRFSEDFTRQEVEQIIKDSTHDLQLL